MAEDGGVDEGGNEDDAMEIKNANLTAAVLEKLARGGKEVGDDRISFTREELEGLQVAGLSYGSYLRAGGKYYQTVANTLILNHCTLLTAEGWRELAAFLATDTAIEELDVGSCELTAEGATVLFRSLKSKVGLRKLDVGGNEGIPPAVWQELGYYLAADSALEELVADMCSSECAAALVGALKTQGGLKVLDISDNAGIPVQVWQQLADALAAPYAALEELVIDNVCAAGAAALMVGLKLNRSLQVLKMSNNEGAGVVWHPLLADALAKHPVLREVWVPGNEVTDEGATALAAALKGNMVLKKLGLSGNHITDTGATALAQVCARRLSHRRLCSLVRTYLMCMMMMMMMMALAQALRQAGALKELNLEGNRLTRVGKDALRAAADEADIELELTEDSNENSDDEGSETDTTSAESSGWVTENSDDDSAKEETA